MLNHREITIFGHNVTENRQLINNNVINIGLVNKYRQIIMMLKQLELVMTVTPTDSSGKCPVGMEWRTGTDLCYRFTDAQMTWAESVVECQQYGADLVSISDRTEQSYIQGSPYFIKFIFIPF